VDHKEQDQVKEGVGEKKAKRKCQEHQGSWEKNKEGPVKDGIKDDLEGELPNGEQRFGGRGWVGHRQYKSLTGWGGGKRSTKNKKKKKKKEMVGKEPPGYV